MPPMFKDRRDIVNLGGPYQVLHKLVARLNKENLRDSLAGRSRHNGQVNRGLEISPEFYVAVLVNVAVNSPTAPPTEAEFPGGGEAFWLLGYRIFLNSSLSGLAYRRADRQVPRPDLEFDDD